MMNMDMKLVPVSAKNEAVYHRLLQCYEAEFSRLTKKFPDENGIFPLDTELGDSVFALLLFWKEKPVGFAAIEIKGEKSYEGKEYYVIPVCRREGLGSQFARQIFAQYPGNWEIKQIQGATDAKNFWQRTLTLKGPKILDLQEDLFQDPYWGPVTRQKFVSSSDGI